MRSASSSLLALGAECEGGAFAPPPRRSTSNPLSRGTDETVDRLDSEILELDDPLPEEEPLLLTEEPADEAPADEELLLIEPPADETPAEDAIDDEDDTDDDELGGRPTARRAASERGRSARDDRDGTDGADSRTGGDDTGSATAFFAFFTFFFFFFSWTGGATARAAARATSAIASFSPRVNPRAAAFLPGRLPASSTLFPLSPSSRSRTPMFSLRAANLSRCFIASRLL